MRRISEEMVTNALLNIFPDVHRELLKKIEEVIPLEGPEFEVAEAIAKYCLYRGVSSHDLGVKDRKELFAALILIYQPVKLHRLSKRRLKNGIIKGMSDATGCNPQLLANWVGEIITHYHIYSDFRSVIQSIKNKIENIS